MTITSETMSVTPALAGKWLVHNPKNRKISANLVRALVQEMLEGRWRLNGEAIILDRDGNLLDGQHRLQAIVDSATTISMVVTRGVDPDAFDTIGCGRPRSQSDVLAIAGYKNTVATAATTRLIKWYRSGYPSLGGYKITNSEVIDMMEAEPGIAAHVSRMNGMGGLRTIRAGSHFYAVTYEANQISSAITDKFIDGVAHGENLNRGDARLTYREWMVNRPTRRAAKPEMPFLLGVKAWNAFAKKRAVGVLRMNPSETYPRLMEGDNANETSLAELDAHLRFQQQEFARTGTEHALSKLEEILKRHKAARDGQA